MKAILLIPALWIAAVCSASSEVTIDEESFGKSLGGWRKRTNSVAEYPLSGAVYRTYKPEISPTPDAGIFVSIRIDHVRGWLSSDDHAILEITVNSKGGIASAQSNIAIQGKSITSEVILGGNAAGKALLVPKEAVEIGTDLVSDISAKLLRENIVEAGRVSFPAVLKHNYNRLYQAIRVDGVQVLPSLPTVPPASPVTPPAPPIMPPAAATPTNTPTAAAPSNPALEVKSQ